MFISASAKLALLVRYSRRFCHSSRECFVRAAVHVQKEMTDETQMAAAPPRDNRREVRAITFFAVVGVLVFVGAGMRGNLFNSDGGDAFATLGYLADLGTGSFYVLAKYIEVGGPDVSHAYGDYGTRFLAAAGVLNLLAALHAYEAARGRKA